MLGFLRRLFCTDRQNDEDSKHCFLHEETARQAAERAQREEQRQREQLRVTLNSIGDAVVVTDVRGLVTFLNPVAQELTGWKQADAVGQQLDEVFRIINEESRRTVESPVSKVLETGLVVGLANHTLLLARDGREIPIDDSGAPIRDEQGTVSGVVVVFRDVTEARRAAEARLHLAAIVESSEDAIISKDLEGRITSWNKAAERLYGYTAEEILGKPLALLVPPNHPNELQEILDRMKRGERIEHYETERVRKDGSQFHVSLSISPIKNAEGKIVGASKIARDITGSKRNEAALAFLAQSSKVLAQLLDVPSTLQRVAGLAVPHFADWCAVDMLGPDGALQRMAVAHVDPAKVQLAHDLQRRYPPDPGAPRGVWHILRTGKAELVTEISDAMLAESAPDEELRRILRELGLRSYMGVPLSVRGKTVGVLTFIAAESGHRYEPADLRLAEDLAHRAGIAIENAQLYGDLKEADRRKDEFLAMLAHELRNPLAPIRNALHLMKMPGASEEAIKRAREVTERQVQQMVRLVDDLLDVSRIMRGRIDLRRESVELSRVIAQAVETVQPILDAQGQQLVLSVPPEPVWVEADPVRIVQVIGNLLNNAAKFSQGPGRVWLSVEPGANGSEVVFRVRDEGMGISADLLPHVFELFVQGDKSLERTRGGLGIGLTVVQRLVEMHGGTVTASSAGPGRGSEFIVRLPVASPGQRAEAAQPAQQPPRTANPRRVLVVDDNVDGAESIALLLRLWGNETRVAHTGPEALRVAEEYRPDVVLLDIGLPEMSGYEVARRLRQQPHFRRTVLAAVTGYGQDNDRQLSRQAGIDHHLTKPVAPETLQQLIAGAAVPAPE
jgi:PAS domain S-box-containing protein